MLLSALLAAGAFGQAAPRVTVIGASLSRGMSLREEAEKRGAAWFVAKMPEARKTSIGLGTLYASLGHGTVVDRSDVYLFTDPLGRGARQIAGAIADEPELILAVDFLFWFGYWPETEKLPSEEPGSALLQKYGKADLEIEKTLKSLEKQERGFAYVDELLAKTPARIVLGDYPDMFGANPLMLSPNRVPLRRTLDELNRRLRAFAESRPRVVLFGLADYVARSKSGQVELPGGEGRRVTTEAAIQGDNLHPTRLGTALVSHELLGFLHEKLDADAARLLPVRPPFSILVEKAGAAPHYLELLEAPKPAAGSAAK